MIKEIKVLSRSMILDYINCAKPNIETNGIILFNRDLAEQIILFVNNLSKEIEQIWVHCYAGISRSGAVGLWATRYLELNEELFRSKHPHIQPNETILEILSDASGMTKKRINFWSNI